MLWLTRISNMLQMDKPTSGRISISENHRFSTCCCPADFEFSLWFRLCNIRLRAFDGSWLNLIPPSWDLSLILQMQKWIREVDPWEDSGRWQNSTQFWPFPFLQVMPLITQNISDDAVTISHVSEQHSWFSTSKWKEIAAAPQGFN